MIIFALVFVSNLSFSQLPKHSVNLNTPQSFTKIQYSQITDSFNIIQSKPGYQFEYFEIDITQNQIRSIDPFMKDCKSIQSIINKYGDPTFDFIELSSESKIKTLSNFYYSVENVKMSIGYQLKLIVMYPREDIIASL